MTTGAMASWHSPRFEDFLFAPVGKDRSGATVSVVSALARRGVDPWDEAAVLADLPEADARSRLEALLVSLDDIPSVAENRRSIVGRLLALLPERGSIETGISAGVRVTISKRTQTILWLVLIATMVVGQIVAMRTGSVNQPRDEPSIGVGAPQN